MVGVAYFCERYVVIDHKTQGSIEFSNLILGLTLLISFCPIHIIQYSSNVYRNHGG